MSPNLIAAAEGIVLGAVTVVIWRTASSRAPRVEFWASVADLARSLVGGGDERDFLRQYGRVLNLLVRYLGRQALILGLSFLPVTLFVMLLVPHLHGPDVSTATDRERSSLERIEDDGTAQPPSQAAVGALSPAGGEVAVGSLFRDSGHIESPQPGTDLALTAFAEVHTVRRQTAETLAEEGNDRLWSWLKLSEWEISFYAALSVASAAGMLVRARRPA